MDIITFCFFGGYFLQNVGSLILLSKIFKQRTVYGLSFDSHICYLFATIIRILWSSQSELSEKIITYFELLASILTSSILVLSIRKHKHTLSHQDFKLCKYYNLIGTSAIISVVFHYRNEVPIPVIMFAFTIYLETLALLPQVFIMHKVIEIESLTSIYVTLLFIARLLRLCFWLILFLEEETYIGPLIADFLHFLLSLNFLYLWISKFNISGPLL